MTSDIQRLIEFDFLRATEIAALNCMRWIGKGDKETADAAACDAIRGMFDLMDMRGEVVIGEGIKDDAPGLFTLSFCAYNLFLSSRRHCLEAGMRKLFGAFWLGLAALLIVAGSLYFFSTKASDTSAYRSVRCLYRWADDHLPGTGLAH